MIYIYVSIHTVLYLIYTDTHNIYIYTVYAQPFRFYVEEKKQHVFPIAHKEMDVHFCTLFTAWANAKDMARICTSSSVASNTSDFPPSILSKEVVDVPPLTTLESCKRIIFALTSPLNWAWSKVAFADPCGSLILYYCNYSSIWGIFKFILYACLWPAVSGLHILLPLFQIFHF